MLHTKHEEGKINDRTADRGKKVDDTRRTSGNGGKK